MAHNHTQAMVTMRHPITHRHKPNHSAPFRPADHATMARCCADASNEGWVAGRGAAADRRPWPNSCIFAADVFQDIKPADLSASV